MEDLAQQPKCLYSLGPFSHPSKQGLLMSAFFKTIYREERKTLAREVFDYAQSVNIVHSRSKSGKTVTLCETWTNYLENVMDAVGSEPSVNLEKFRAVCSMQPGQCMRCWSRWEEKAIKVWSGNRSFRDILKSVEW